MVLDIADTSSDRLHKSSKETFPSWIIGYIELPLYLGRGETQNVHIHHKTLLWNIIKSFFIGKNKNYFF